MGTLLLSQGRPGMLTSGDFAAGAEHPGLARVPAGEKMGASRRERGQHLARHGDPLGTGLGRRTRAGSWMGLCCSHGADVPDGMSRGQVGNTET